jgi:hypothetical protein
MAISHHPENKFAFLFTGSADPQYVADLRKVTETLIRFYNYPASNITIVAGAAVADFTPHIPPDSGNIFETAGLNNKYVLSGAASADYIADFSSRMKTFMTGLDNEIITEYQNSAFFYFTGVGATDTSGPLPLYQLEIAKIGVNAVKLDHKTFKGLLVTNNDQFLMNNHINILMQQSNSYGFFESASGLSSVDAQLTFTSACNSGQTIDTNATGSSFTGLWTDGLQFKTRNLGTSSIYADQENTFTTTPPDPNTEDSENFLISLKKAWCFAARAQASAVMTPMFDFRGESLDYLGLPDLIIHDGPSDTDSPDINVVHTSIPAVSRSQYLFDSGGNPRNTISIHVELQGTHCVRSFCINLGIYRSLEQVSVDEPLLNANKTVTGFWKPGDPIPDTSFDTLMLSQIDYNCIVARVSTKCNGTFTGIDGVNPADNDNEAQLNITIYEEQLQCIVTHVDESPAGANNGSITIAATGGVPFPASSPSPYEYNINSGQWGSTNQFNNLSGGPRTVCARDSAGTTCCQTVDLTAQGSGVSQCEQLLDNDYIHICRTTSGSLKCTFKAYPHLPEGYYRTRGYKIKWKPPILHPVTPSIPPSDIIEFHNVTVVSSGLDHIGGSYRPYMILRVNDNRPGEILLKYPKPGIVTDGQRVSVPVKIYFRRMFGIWPPWWWRWPWHWDWRWRWPWDWRWSWPWRWPYRWRWPWLWPFSWWRRIARFKLIIVPHMYDIEEY